jgi:protoporphyrinogen/coproporphyrinogen III oxidase
VAARTLVLAGEEVTLLEASDHLGGTVARHTVGGIDLDAGAESFAIRNGTVAALAESLGLADAVVSPNPEGAWLRRADGTDVPLPSSSLLGIPGVPLAQDVTAVIGQRAAWRAMLDLLLPGTVGARSKTLGELVRTRMGSGVLEGLVAPICQGVHSRHPDDLELDRVAPELRQALLREGSLARAVRESGTGARTGAAVQGIRGGVNRLVEELVADLDRFGVRVRLHSAVTAIDEGAVQIGDETIEGDVLIAAPHLLNTGPDTAERTTVAFLVVDAPALDSAPRGTGVLVAAGAEGVTARALTHATAKWPWLAERVAPGRHVIRLSYRGAVTQTAAVKDAEALLGVPLDTIVDFTTVEWSRPAPQGPAPDGVWVTGQATSGTGLANVVAHATATAEALLASRTA